MRLIIKIAFAKEISISHLKELEKALDSFRVYWKKIFNDIFPKHHYLMHIVDDIKLYFC